MDELLKQTVLSSMNRHIVEKQLVTSFIQGSGECIIALSVSGKKHVSRMEILKWEFFLPGSMDQQIFKSNHFIPAKKYPLPSLGR